jgi:hypothetical protein
MEERLMPQQLRDVADRYNRIVYQVVVVDMYANVRGYYLEACVTTNKGEADSWAKQWASEYNHDEGYAVQRAKYSPTCAPRKL